MNPDNNQPTNQIPVTPAPVVPAQPVQPAQNNMQSTVSMPDQKPKGSNKMIVLLLIILLLVAGAGAYLYFANYQASYTKPAQNYNTTQNVQYPTNTPTPTLSPASLTVDNPQTDIQSIEKDASGL